MLALGESFRNAVSFISSRSDLEEYSVFPHAAIIEHVLKRLDGQVLQFTVIVPNLREICEFAGNLNVTKVS